MPASYGLAPNIEPGVAACSGPFGCLEPIFGSLVALTLWAGLSTGLLFAPRANVRAALSALRSEREAVVAERDALETFASTVEELPAAAPASTVEGGGVGVVGANSQPRGMAELRTAYRETVMDVDHFEQDYGESLPESLANEFGDGVAGAVLGNNGLSPQIKRVVLDSAAEGRARREQYLDTLDRERERLSEAGERLDDAADRCVELDGDRLRRRPFTELQSRYERLDDTRGALTSMLERRQEQIQEGVVFGWHRQERESVHRYLYRDIDATYPVLADGTRVLERIDETERRLTTALTAKV